MRSGGLFVCGEGEVFFCYVVASVTECEALV